MLKQYGLWICMFTLLACGGSEAVVVTSSQPHLTKDKEELTNLLGLNQPRDTTSLLKSRRDVAGKSSNNSVSERDSLIARIGDLMDEVMFAKRLAEEQAILIDSLEGEVLALKSGRGVAAVGKEEPKKNESKKELDKKTNLVEANSTRKEEPKKTIVEKSDTRSDEDPARSSYREGVSLMKEQKFKAASARFEKLIVESPDHPLAVSFQYQLAECYYMMGDYSQALVDYQKALTFQSSIADAIKLRIGQCYMKLKKKERAKETFEGLVADHPKSNYAKLAKDYLAKL